MRTKTLFVVANFALFGMIGAPAHAGLVGDGTNTVTAFFYIDAPSTPPPVCTQADAFCEQQYELDAMNMKQTVLTIPAQFIQAPMAGVTIGVEDLRIVITNQIAPTLCSDGTSVGAACGDIFTGFEFLFSSGVDITAVSADPGSDFLPNDTPNGMPPHYGLQLLSPTEILVDVTGDDPGIGGKLILDVTTAGVIPPPVPEPSTWAMMLLGFVGLGFIGYRRRGGARRIAAQELKHGSERR
jgi:hypothetical protein